MEFIIKSKNIKEIKNYKNLGDYFSNERFYSIMNKRLDENLKSRSRFVSFILSYFFYSNDFKKNQYIDKRTNKIIKFIDFFCFLSFLTFIAMFLIVIFLTTANAKTLVESTINEGVSSIISNFGEAFFINIEENIILLSFSVFFLLIFIWWIIIYTKFRKKCKSLSLNQYLLMKIDFCLKSGYILKLLNRAKNISKHHKKENEYTYCIENFVNQNKNVDLWLNLQIINEMCLLFNDFNLILKSGTTSKKQFNSIKKIINTDFLNIKIN